MLITALRLGLQCIYTMHVYSEVNLAIVSGAHFQAGVYKTKTTDLKEKLFCIACVGQSENASIVPLQRTS